jgi:hypothetical protein
LGFAIACGVLALSVVIATDPDDVSATDPSLLAGEQALSASAAPLAVSVVRANRTIVFPIIIPSPPNENCGPRLETRGAVDPTPVPDQVSVGLKNGCTIATTCALVSGSSNASLAAAASKPLGSPGKAVITFVA